MIVTFLAIFAVNLACWFAAYRLGRFAGFSDGLECAAELLPSDETWTGDPRTLGLLNDLHSAPVTDGAQPNHGA